jgi:hypothetical protein
MTNAEVITIKEYIDARFSAVESARVSAYNAMEKRLDGMNEFRDTLRDQSGKFPTREELSLSLKAMDADIRDLRNFKALMEGKADQSAVNRATLFSIVGISIGVISIFMGLMK